MEVIFRLGIGDMLDPADYFISILFLIPIAIGLFLICSSFHHTANYILSMVLFLLSGMIYSSQLIYYKFFRTFYSLYSAANAGQVMDFWKDILNYMFKYSGWILLLLLPGIGMVLLKRKIVPNEPGKWRFKGVLIFSLLVIHFGAVGIIHVSGREQEHAAYDLYYKTNFPALSVQRLGLITTMRIDLQRQVTGWSPELTEPLVPPAPQPSKEAQKDNKKEKKEAEEKQWPLNVMDIDFDQLIASENNETIKNMHNYFKHVKPTSQNEYTGKFKDYNLVFITAESFAPYAIHKEITPTLYKMAHEGFRFTNFYTPLWGVSTSDGEYVACTSLIPKSGVWSFYLSGDNHLPFVMGNQLKKLGYKTVAYHNHTYTYYRRDVSHPNMGYEYKGLGNGLDVRETWPESDLEMMQKTIPEYINDQPFHAYYMTVSGHMQYSFIGNSMAYKNREAVKDLPLSEQAKAYLATQVELDRALEYLLNKLEEAGIADRTLIVISPDHYPYGLDDKTIDELAGHQVEENFELYKSPLIIYAKGMEPVTIDEPASSLDIIPTLSNLLGLEYDSRLLMGRDIFSDAPPLVMFRNKSFITDKGFYNALTGEFTPVNGSVADEVYMERIKSVVDQKFYYSVKILETDYYRKVLGE